MNVMREAFERTFRELERMDYEAWTCLLMKANVRDVVKDVKPMFLSAYDSARDNQLMNTLNAELERLNIAFCESELKEHIREYHNHYPSDRSWTLYEPYDSGHMTEHIDWDAFTRHPCHTVFKVTTKQSIYTAKEIADVRRRLVAYWADHMNYELLTDLLEVV